MCQRDMLYQHVMHIQNSYTKNIFWVKSFDNLSINESLCNHSDQFPADFNLADYWKFFRFQNSLRSSKYSLGKSNLWSIYAVTMHNMTIQLDGMSAFVAFFSVIDKRIVPSFGESVLVNVYREKSRNPEIREAFFHWTRSDYLQVRCKSRQRTLAGQSNIFKYD